MSEAFDIASAPAALRAGQTFHGAYRLVERLGQGAMGEVWKAEHLRLPKPVAIKVLLPSAGGTEELLRRFEREAEIGSTLAHPNIVHTFDFNELPDGRRYIAMELLEGESLADRLTQGPLSYGEAARVVTEAGAGLKVAHDAGVIHRDLKPDNLFLALAPHAEEPYQVKILDFGISKLQRADTALTQDLSVLGTPAFMSPEQAMGQADRLGPRSDQFSLATIAYEMLAGVGAFGGDTIAEVVYRVTQDAPPPIEELAPNAPPHACAALNRALAKDPADRFEDIGAFVRAFCGEESFRPVHAPSRPPRLLDEEDDAPMPAGVRSSGRVLGVGLAVLALLAGSVALGMKARESARDDPASRDIAPPADEEGFAAPESLTASEAEGTPAEPRAGGTGDEGADSPVRATPRRAPRSAMRASGTRGEAAAPGSDRVTEGSLAMASAASMEAGAEPGEGALGGISNPQELLLQAQLALAEQQTVRALGLARQAQQLRDSDAARAVLAKAHCQNDDLLGAHVAARRLPSGIRARVARFCRALGIELVEKTEETGSPDVLGPDSQEADEETPGRMPEASDPSFGE